MRTSILLALAVAWPTSVVHGEPPSRDVVPKKARLLAERGRALHDAGDYGSAITAFTEAYVLAPSAGLLFNLAQAYRLHGNCDDARLMYRRYLSTGPAPEARALAEGHLNVVERCARDRAVDVTLASHDADPRTGPGPRVQPLHVVDAPEASARGRKAAGATLAVAGAVAAGVGAYYAFQAQDTERAIEQAYADGAKSKDIRELDARGERSATLGKVFGIGGGVGIAAGVTLYVLGKRAEREVPSRLPVVAVTRGGAEVGWSWRF